MIDTNFINELYNEELESKDNYDIQLEISQLSESDQELLQEMHFSKKDLQDPKTIQKIEKILNTKVYDNIYVFIVSLLFIFPIIISIIINPTLVVVGLIGGLSLTILTISKTFDAIVNMPQKVFDKNYEKFKKQVTRLKEKTQEKLNKETNQKNIAKYKEIITNCDKVLKAIQEREKKIIKEEDEKDYKYIKKIYNEFIKFLENPPRFYSDSHIISDVVYLAQNLKISEQQIANKFKKKFNSEYTLKQGLFEYLGGNKNESFEDLIRRESVKLGNVNLNVEVNTFEMLGDDAIFIGKDCKVYSIYSDDYILNKDSFYNFFKEYDTINLLKIKKFKEYIVEVDKELGYYRLSEPPKNVKRKEFPL